MANFTFKQLWDVYPPETVKQVEFFNMLGGQWPTLVGNDQYKNTCALRLSYALNALGIAIPSDISKIDGNFKDGKGRNLIVRASTAEILLNTVIGKSSWGISKKVGASLGESGVSVPPMNGLLLYLVPGGTSSGHVDLWNSGTCRVNCHENYALSATSVELWVVN